MQPEKARPFDPLDPEARNERLHGFAHALKNRIGAVWQAANLLKDLPDGPEKAQLLALAEKNYFAAARELEQLMDDFAVPRGITRLQTAPVDLKALLERCIANTAFRTTKKDQDVHLDAAPIPGIKGDPAVLEQLFDALLSNASKFSGPGSSIRVSIQPRDGGVAVAVTDQGVGLTAEDLHAIFTRYALLSSRSTAGESQARGTLARAKQWALAHGGDLSAESQGTGCGSTFTVTLPAAHAH